jgi:hypothetical protein
VPGTHPGAHRIFGKSYGYFAAATYKLLVRVASPTGLDATPSIDPAGRQEFSDPANLTHIFLYIGLYIEGHECPRVRSYV